MTPATTRIVTVIAAFIAGLGAFSIAIFLIAGRGPLPITAPSAIGGPFRLVDQNGAVVTEDALKGKPSIVFFGFTHCPDICPTTLFDVSEVYKALGRGLNFKTTMGNVLTLTPPLVVTERQMIQALDIIEKAITAGS